MNKACMKASDVTRTVWDAASADVRRMAREVRGFVTELSKELERATGVRWHRQHIQMWLADDPSKRTEPRYGAGTIMLAAAKRLNERTKHDDTAGDAQADR